MQDLPPKPLRVLVACEFSGTVRDAFIRAGHDAVSCDIIPSSTPGPHHTGDVLEILGDDWDLMIAHPPCTYLSSSGLHWNKRIPGREEKTLEAIAFAEALWDAPIPRVALENPVGCLSTRSKLGKATQYIQPHEFGHDASKRTGLWLRGLPKLQPTNLIPGRMVNGRPRWANQTDSGQNRLGPSEDRAAIRAVTYAGIAQAMADTWGAQ